MASAPTSTAPLQNRPLHKRPVVVVGVALLGLALYFGWSSREWIGWQLVSADAAPVDVGPARIAVPQSLPARMLFGADGDVKLVAGEISYDAMALSLGLTPLQDSLVGTDAERTIKELQLALLADEPSAHLEERRFGAHPGFVSRTKVGKATSLLVVAVADGALVRLEIAVRGQAPAKWLDAAHLVVDSLRIDDVVARDGLWKVFAERALDACGSGDVGACLWSAKSAWQRSDLDEARVALEKGLVRAGPIEALWDEAKAVILASAAASAARAGAALAPKPVSMKRLDDAVQLHLLLGEVELASEEPAAAIERWTRVWSMDSQGRIARRLLEEGANRVDEDSAAAWLKLASAIDERFGTAPAVGVAAAKVAARAGSYDLAKAIAQRVYDAGGDPVLRRDVVTVPLSAPPKIEPLPCPRGTTSRTTTSDSGLMSAACVDRAGKRQGPSRSWFVTTGYVLEEVTYRDDELGAPDRRYWENGQLQRESVVDANGAVTVQRWDPFGRPVELDDGPEPSEAAVDVERP